MDKALLSVGLDVGTTTTQMVVSRLRAQNRASGFAVPRMEITDREILYRSPVRFTPLLSGELVDGQGIRKILEREYAAAGIRPESVDSGAVIITGETSRKENARAVLEALAALAGDFVVATAGPELESLLAAKGAGAVAFSEKSQKPVLHMDIGGGTSNLALCHNGRVIATGCLNVGGRLVKFDEQGTVTYVSPVLAGITELKVGQLLTEEEAMRLACLLASVLEMAAGRKEKEALFSRFITGGTREIPISGQVTVSFSGGVADCIETAVPWRAYGDLGPLLGRAIRKSALCRESYRLGDQTIRATVIGAGSHSLQLSGSTVYLKNTKLPLQNLPVAELTLKEQESGDLAAIIRSRVEKLEGEGVLYLPGFDAPAYPKVSALADAIAAGLEGRSCLVVLRADMAKALGHALALRLPPQTPCLCLDGLHIPPQSYLDIGKQIGPAIGVVVKTLVFEK